MPLQVCFSFPSLPFPSLSRPKASQYSPVEEQSAAREEERGGLHLPPRPDPTPPCVTGPQTRERPATAHARTRPRLERPPYLQSPGRRGTRCGTWPVTQRARPKRPATATLYPLWARPSSGLSVVRLSPPAAPRCSEARWPRSRPPRHRPLSCVPGAGGRRAGHTASHPLPPSPGLCVQEPGWPGLGLPSRVPDPAETEQRGATGGP